MSVLLAKTFDPDKHDPQGWWMSEKLDGVRALWDPVVGFRSRTNKPFVVPAWFAAAMPDNPLDGEFFVGRGLFQKTVSYVRKKVPVEAEWEQVNYHVFDCPVDERPFEERMLTLGRVLCKVSSRVRPVVHEQCNGIDHLMLTFNKILSEGGEGVMLRQPCSLYEGKRSGTLLKLKGEIDGLARVIGIQPGTGKHKGRMGALECIEVTHTGQPVDQAPRFKVGTGFSDAERSEQWNNNTVIRWRAHERTTNNVPRHPAFVCRHEGD